MGTSVSNLTKEPLPCQLLDRICKFFWYNTKLHYYRGLALLEALLVAVREVAAAPDKVSQLCKCQSASRLLQG